jgi:hypothetical protein
MRKTTMMIKIDISGDILPPFLFLSPTHRAAIFHYSIFSSQIVYPALQPILLILIRMLAGAEHNLCGFHILSFINISGAVAFRSALLPVSRTICWQ